MQTSCPVEGIEIVPGLLARILPCIDDEIIVVVVPDAST